MEIFLIRHGISTGNGHGRFLGWSDHPLAEDGRRQAVAVAARLAPFGPMPVICSDLLRARQTSAYITEQWGGTITTDAGWRETHCGDFEDRLWDDFSKNVELRTIFDADPFHACMPGGESVAMMAERVVAAFTELCGNAVERVAVVTHGGPIRAVLAHCLKIPADRYWTLDASHGGLTHLSLVDDWITIRTVNDTSHLAEVEHD